MHLRRQNRTSSSTRTLLQYILVVLFLCAGYTSNAQKTISKLLKKYNTQSISYMSVQELDVPNTDMVILDAREKAEYDVSHLEGAVHVGYDFFNIERIEKLIQDKSKQVVVYCSLGIRSEDIGEQLINAGYTNVYNLFGGIFEWCNNDLPIYNNQDKPTDSIHAFSKEWGKWLNKGIKVYE